MTRHILEKSFATIGNTTDNFGVVIEFNDASIVRFATYTEKPNGSKINRRIHYNLSDAASDRDSLLAIRRKVMTENLEIVACGL